MTSTGHFHDFECKTLDDLLQNTRVDQIVPDRQEIVTLPPDSTIAKAIEILASKHILSAPLEYNKEEAQAKKQRYAGFVDMFDLVAYALKMCTQEKRSNDNNSNNNKNQMRLLSWCQDIQQLEVKGQEFENHLVRDVIDLSRYNPFCTISPKAMMPQLLFLFQKGLHRVAVLDDEADSSSSQLPTIRNIISQSNVIKYLANNITHFGKIATLPISDLNLGQKARVIAINNTSRAVHGFYQMLQRHVSAVAVVDKQGILEANLSASDLRGLSHSKFSTLLRPVIEYLSISSSSITTPLTVESSTTFESVILKLAASRSHRLWIVDENGRPIGVISLTDIMKLLDLRCYVKATEEID